LYCNNRYHSSYHVRVVQYCTNRSSAVPSVCGQASAYRYVTTVVNSENQSVKLHEVYGPRRLVIRRYQHLPNISYWYLVVLVVFNTSGRNDIIPSPTKHHGDKSDRDQSGGRNEY